MKALPSLKIYNALDGCRRELSRLRRTRIADRTPRHNAEILMTKGAIIALETLLKETGS